MTPPFESFDEADTTLHEPAEKITVI